MNKTYRLDEVRSRYSPSFFHRTTGAGCPLGGAHFKTVSSPRETSVSFGSARKSSLKSEKISFKHNFQTFSLGLRQFISLNCGTFEISKLSNLRRVAGARHRRGGINHMQSARGSHIFLPLESWKVEIVSYNAQVGCRYCRSFAMLPKYFFA